MASGKLVAAFFAVVVGLAVALVAVYESQQRGLPPAEMRFSRSSAAQAAAENATVRTLDAKDVRSSTSNLDDYLNTAKESGNATLANRLQVEEFATYLRHRTGQAGPVVFVAWMGAVVRVEWTGA